MLLNRLSPCVLPLLLLLVLYSWPTQQQEQWPWKHKHYSVYCLRWGDCNKMLQTGWLVKPRRLFCTDQGVGFWWRPSPVLQTWKGVESSLGSLLEGRQSRSWELPSHGPITFQRTHYLTSSHWELGCQQISMRILGSTSIQSMYVRVNMYNIQSHYGRN